MTHSGHRRHSALSPRTYSLLLCARNGRWERGRAIVRTAWCCDDVACGRDARSAIAGLRVRVSMEMHGNVEIIDLDSAGLYLFDVIVFVLYCHMEMSTPDSEMVSWAIRTVPLAQTFLELVQGVPRISDSRRYLIIAYITAATWAPK